MHFLNRSDLVGSATFTTPGGRIEFDAMLNGFMDGITVEEVPSSDANELLVMFSVEGGPVRAAVRVRDLLRLTVEHYPALLLEVAAELKK